MSIDFGWSAHVIDIKTEFCVVKTHTPPGNLHVLIWDIIYSDTKSYTAKSLTLILIIWMNVIEKPLNMLTQLEQLNIVNRTRQNTDLC